MESSPPHAASRIEVNKPARRTFPRAFLLTDGWLSHLTPCPAGHTAVMRRRLPTVSLVTSHGKWHVVQCWNSCIKLLSNTRNFLSEIPSGLPGAEELKKKRVACEVHFIGITAGNKSKRCSNLHVRIIFWQDKAFVIFIQLHTRDAFILASFAACVGVWVIKWWVRNAPV